MFFFDVVVTTNYYYQQGIQSDFKMYLFSLTEIVSYTLILTSSILNSVYYDINLLTQIWGRGYVALNMLFTY